MPQNLITCDSLVLPDQLLCFIFCQWGVITGSPQGDPSAGLYVNGVGWGVIECLKVIILSVLKPDLSNNGYEATSDIVTTVGDSKSSRGKSEIVPAFPPNCTTVRVTRMILNSAGPALNATPLLEL